MYDRDSVRQETRRRLAEVDPELARDDEEVERQMPEILRIMIEEAGIRYRHYQKIAEEALSERYRNAYIQQALKWSGTADELRAVTLD